jgi:hypothetical protein
MGVEGETKRMIVIDQTPSRPALLCVVGMSAGGCRFAERSHSSYMSPSQTLLPSTFTVMHCAQSKVIVFCSLVRKGCLPESRMELFPRPLHCAAVLGKHDATEVVPGDPS